MPKKILLIENDSAFAGQLSEALEAAGFDVRVSPEGKAGLDQAREWGPHGIVLCVELPGMSGYLVCRKLRKDDATRGIPLVLTSAEATAETFADHRALKMRADEYLLKPYAPGALMEKLAAIGLAAEGESDPALPGEDLVSLDEGMGLESFAGEAGAELPSLDLESLPDEPSGEPPPTALDDDLAFLDEAFDGIATAGTGSPAPYAPELELLQPFSATPAAAGTLDLDPELAPHPEVAGPEQHAAPERPAGFEPLPVASEPPSPVPAPFFEAAPTPPAPAPVQAPARTTLVGVPRSAAITLPPTSSRASLDAAGLERLQRELGDARAALSARDADAKSLRDRVEEAVQRAEAAESAAAERDAELASVRAKLEAITGQARKSEGELKSSREEARRALAELEELRSRLAEAERRASQGDLQAQRIDELEQELESARTELLVARNEVEGARGEVETRTNELQGRITELETQSARHEERVLKAYQKIKGDEKVKDKVRKAIAIAAQLLEEGLPAEPTAPPPASAEKPEKPRLA